MSSAGPVRITAYGAHLLAVDHRTRAHIAALQSDLEAQDFHEQNARVWTDLSMGLRAKTIKYVPGFPDHYLAYQRAVKELKP